MGRRGFAGIAIAVIEFPEKSFVELSIGRRYTEGHVRSCAPAQHRLIGCAIFTPHTIRAQPLAPITNRTHLRRSAMKKATHADAVLIARSMNMKVDVVWDIIGGMNYASYSELVMAVLICLKPLPLERLTSPGR
jgi:hypothetical protein